jgi:hypothetical protein
LIHLVRALRNYHAVHHKCPWKNLNLVLGADQLVAWLTLASSLVSRNRAELRKVRMKGRMARTRERDFLSP